MKICFYIRRGALNLNEIQHIFFWPVKLIHCSLKLIKNKLGLFRLFNYVTLMVMMIMFRWCYIFGAVWTYCNLIFFLRKTILNELLWLKYYVNNVQFNLVCKLLNRDDSFKQFLTNTRLNYILIQFNPIWTYLIAFEILVKFTNFGNPHVFS